MLKEIRYGQRLNEILVYLLEGRRCVFSGTGKERRVGTINAAERVIKAIAEEEGINPGSVEWFDLQTHLGYEFVRPGKYNYDQVCLGSGTGTAPLQSLRWKPVPCPPEVVAAFREQIG